MSDKASKSTTAKMTEGKSKTTNSVRLTEEDKREDSKNYILNPDTNKYVKRESPIGKKLVKAEMEQMSTTSSSDLVLFIQTLQDQLGLNDSEIKAAFLADKSIKSKMPFNFPSIWGGEKNKLYSTDYPKQPSSPYMLFIREIRNSVIEANPGVDNTKIISIMNKMWEEMNQKERAKYVDKSGEDRFRYEYELTMFKDGTHEKIVKPYVKKSVV